MEELLKGEIVKTFIIAATVFGVDVKVVQTFILINLVEESENIPTAKNKLIKQMKLKFENCYRLNLGVNNVKAFVDKYIHKYKICGININHLERIPIIITWICAVAGIGCGCICYLQNYSVKVGSLYEIYGVGSAVILKLTEIILDAPYKKKVLYINLIDFFENSLQIRLMQDVKKIAAVSNEIEEEMNEMPVIQELKGEQRNQEAILHYRKKEKESKEEEKKASDKNAEAIIEDVISQFLS